MAYTTLAGQTVHTSQWRGKVVLVNFWATSCSSCVAEMPDLVATYQKFRHEGFETVAVAMHYDPPAFVQEFAASRQLPFSVSLDQQGVMAEAFGGVRVTPTTFLINKEGQVVKTWLGRPRLQEMQDLIKSLLVA